LFPFWKCSHSLWCPGVLLHVFRQQCSALWLRSKLHRFSEADWTLTHCNSLAAVAGCPISTRLTCVRLPGYDKITTLHWEGLVKSVPFFVCVQQDTGSPPCNILQPVLSMQDMVSWALFSIANMSLMDWNIVQACLQLLQITRTKKCVV
jgi:hypothetical protein